MARIPYHRCIKTEKGRVKDFLAPYIPSDLEGNILDVGCSKGITTMELATLYPDRLVIGCDMNPEVIEESKRLQGSDIGGRVSFYHSNIFELKSSPLRHMKFGGIFMMNNLYHGLSHSRMTDEQIRLTLDLVSKITEEEGYFIVSSTRDYLILKRNNGGFVPYDSKFTTDTSKVRLNRLIDLPRKNGYDIVISVMQEMLKSLNSVGLLLNRKHVKGYKNAINLSEI